MMKTIIVPLDFSEESKNGLDMALMLANKTRVNIQLVHVIDKNTGTDSKLMEKALLNAQLKFDEILKTCKERAGYKCGLSYIISRGKLFKDITDLAEKNEDSIIVMSTHGESGFEELFIGGNAYKIASHSRSPVITVRRSKIPANIGKIVLPLDFTKETREKVPYTVKMAKLLGSEIHLLTVSSTKLKSIESKLSKYADQVSSYLDNHNVPFKLNHLYGNNLTDIIIEYSASVKADLISIMSEQEKSVSNLLLGNYAHQMINKSNTPVLIYPTYPLSVISEDIWTLGAFIGRD
jgi:nucleotide-binding universal stress UspA family protein